MVRSLLFAALVLLAGACSPYEKLSKTDLSYRYRPDAPVAVTSKVLDEGDQLRVFLALHLRQVDPRASLKQVYNRYRFGYRVVPYYRSRKALEQQPDLKFPAYHGQMPDGAYLVSLLVDKRTLPEAILVLTVTDKTNVEAVEFDVRLPFQQRLATRYGLFADEQAQPYLADFLTTRDTASLSTLAGDPAPLMVTFYADAFRPALPPMAPANTAPPQLEASIHYQIRPDNRLVFAQPGLYFVRRDTTQADGFGFVVSQNRYPRVTRAEELVDPLVYITTRKERNTLLRAEDPKLALDDFWLRRAGTPGRARRVIRRYYRQVQNANRLFTTHKAGWKTDRGMVYVVFGPPDQLQRQDGQEVWYYREQGNFPEVKFTFVRRPTIFSDDNYELVRYNDYDQYWYQTVEQWRKGVTRE